MSLASDLDEVATWYLDGEVTLLEAWELLGFAADERAQMSRALTGDVVPAGGHDLTTNHRRVVWRFSSLAAVPTGRPAANDS